jgi:chitinase
MISSGERVMLNGLGSYDPDGGSLQYHWSQVRGSKVSLLDPYSAQAKFLAPLVAEERIFRFTLRVTDIRGADSLPTHVDVIIQP